MNYVILTNPPFIYHSWYRPAWGSYRPVNLGMSQKALTSVFHFQNVPSIHLQVLTLRGLEPIPLSLVHQFITWHTWTNIPFSLTYGRFRVTYPPKPLLCVVVFDSGRKLEYPEETFRLRENTQTGESVATVPTTAPPRHLPQVSIQPNKSLLKQLKD